MEGNQMKMREALIAMVRAETDGDMSLDALCGRCLSKLHGTCKHDGSCWCEKVIEALSAPPRQCDVGTAEEQMKRFDEFTSKYWTLGMAALQWAQMPYEAQEGAGK